MCELYSILKGEAELPYDYNDLNTEDTRLAINCVLASFVNMKGATHERLREEFGIKSNDITECRTFLKDLKNGTFKPKKRFRGTQS